MKNKFRGCLMGGAIGDALGYPIEFIKEIENKEFSRYAREKGVISDDTQMTLFTANGLIWRETRLATKGISVNIEDAVYYAYLDWLETQDKYKININKNTWLKDVKELNVQRAPGQTCISSLSSGKKGTIEKPINDSKGCGGVMRVAPVGLYAKNPEIAGKFGARVAAITHGHIYSTLSSFLLSCFINLITYQDIKLDSALNKAIEIMKKFFKENKLSSKKDLKNFIKIIQNAINLSKKEMLDSQAIQLIGQGWVAEEALAIALYSCFKYSNDFESAIVCAVNHDGDSDSTGAIAGNIIGAYLGYDKIPSYYIDNLELKDVILEIADDLSITDIQFECNKTDKLWLNKYLYCKK